MLKQIQIEAFYPKALTKKIEAHNAKINKLATLEGSITPRKNTLFDKVVAGTITGADALAERAQIRADAVTVDIDGIPLFEERKSFLPEMRIAHNEEADRFAKLAVERRTAIEKHIGDLMTDVQKALAWRADASWRAADSGASAHRSRANAQRLIIADKEWYAEAQARIIQALR